MKKERQGWVVTEAGDRHVELWALKRSKEEGVTCKVGPRATKMAQSNVAIQPCANRPLCVAAKGQGPKWEI